MILPTKWNAEELEEAAKRSLSLFVRGRLAEGSGPYRRAFAGARGPVRELFEATRNLRDLGPEVLRANPRLLEAARYLAGPPLSQDDLDTLAGGKASGRRVLTRETAGRVVEAIRAFLDPFRCPWLDRGGEPTPPEVRTAVDWTASLWAVEKCRTARRGESSALQEAAVSELLLGAGLAQACGIRGFQSLDELPRGHFTREVVLAGAKADFAVRLGDGRLLALECKVSNSALNSVKRLNRETAGKAEHWRTAYGQQVVTAAVLSGVFKVTNLIDAQESGVFIVWDHDLEPLVRFVRQTCRR
jgi:hypothetical protein